MPWRTPSKADGKAKNSEQQVDVKRHEQIQLGLLAIDRSNACPSTKAASDRAELRGRPTDEADAASGCELPEIENSALKMRPISHEESVVALEVTTQPLSEERRVGSLTARGSHSISNESHGAQTSGTESKRDQSCGIPAPNDDSGLFDLSSLESPREIHTTADSVEAQIPPVPPPRDRSRTPPSDHEDEFDFQRRKHKAKRKNLNESQRRLSAEDVSDAEFHHRVEDGAAVTAQATDIRGINENYSCVHSPQDIRQSGESGKYFVDPIDRLFGVERSQAWGQSTFHGQKSFSIHPAETDIGANPCRESRVFCRDQSSFEYDRQNQTRRLERLLGAESIEIELRAREELAQEACRTQDVSALCFALSFTRTHTDKTRGDISTSTIPLSQSGGCDSIVLEVFKSSSPSCSTIESSGDVSIQLSPLHEAAAVGSVEMLALLLDSKKFAIDSRTPNGNTALHICIWEGHVEGAEYLLSRGASSTVANCHGYLAFDFLSASSLEPFSVSEFPLLMNAAAVAAIQKAERVLGVSAQDSASLQRQRFRELSSLADSKHGLGEQHIGKTGEFIRLCAAFDILLHYQEVKYVASRVSLNKTYEWAELFYVLESKGLGDIIDWFLNEQLDGQSLLGLTTQEMRDRGLEPNRASTIWNRLHGESFDVTLEEWLREHGELQLLSMLRNAGIQSVHQLMFANLKSCVDKVGSRRRLERIVEQHHKSSDVSVLMSSFHHFQEKHLNEFAREDAQYIASGGASDHLLGTQLHSSIIDAANEFVATSIRDSQRHNEMRARIQKLKMRARALFLQAEHAEDRANCAAQDHESAIVQLEHQARSHAKVMADKDAELISAYEQLNHLRIEGLSHRCDNSLLTSDGSVPFLAPSLIQAHGNLTIGHLRSDLEVSHLKFDHDDSFTPSTSWQRQTSNSEHFRTLRLINKELQLKEIDLQTKLSQCRRDKELENSAAAALQQRVNKLSNDLGMQKREKEALEHELQTLRTQQESLLSSVARLVGHDERLDAICREVFKAKLVNLQLKKDIYALSTGDTWQLHMENRSLKKQLESIQARIETEQLRTNEGEKNGIDNEMDDHKGSRTTRTRIEEQEPGEKDSQKQVDDEIKNRPDTSNLRETFERVANLRELEIVELRELAEEQERELADKEMKINEVMVAMREKEKDMAALQEKLKIVKVELREMHSSQDRERFEHEQEKDKAARALEKAAKSVERLEQDVKMLREELRIQRDLEEEYKERDIEQRNGKKRELALMQQILNAKEEAERDRQKWEEERSIERGKWERDRNEWQLKKEEWLAQRQTLVRSAQELESRLSELQQFCLTQREDFDKVLAREREQRERAREQNENEKKELETLVSSLEEQYSEVEGDLSQRMNLTWDYSEGKRHKQGSQNVKRETESKIHLETICFDATDPVDSAISQVAESIRILKGGISQRMNLPADQHVIKTCATDNVDKLCLKTSKPNASDQRDSAVSQIEAPIQDTEAVLEIIPPRRSNRVMTASVLPTRALNRKKFSPSVSLNASS